MWPFIDPAVWAAYMAAQNGEAYVPPVELFICEICKEDLGQPSYIEIDPVQGTFNKRRYHMSCLVAHMLAHMDDLNDEIINYINRRLGTP